MTKEIVLQSNDLFTIDDIKKIEAALGQLLTVYSFKFELPLDPTK